MDVDGWMDITIDVWMGGDRERERERETPTRWEKVKGKGKRYLSGGGGTP